MLGKIVFVTNNRHKLEEVSAILAGIYEVVSLEQIGCTDDIEETAHTLEGNALIKAKYIYDRYGIDCFADDTGLEVEALDNAPGVYSARYAGEEKSAENNMNLLLRNLEGVTNRNARFRTVICAILHGKELFFEGVVDGKILYEPVGNGGFGYDPIFMPDGYNLSFAELNMADKNKISHRGRAVEAFCSYLKM